MLRQVCGTYVIAGGSRDESVSRSHDVCPTRRVPLWPPLLARRSAQGDNGESLIMHPLKAHAHRLASRTTDSTPDPNCENVRRRVYNRCRASRATSSLFPLPPCTPASLECTSLSLLLCMPAQQRRSTPHGPRTSSETAAPWPRPPHFIIRSATPGCAPFISASEADKTRRLSSHTRLETRGPRAHASEYCVSS